MTQPQQSKRTNVPVLLSFMLGNLVAILVLVSIVNML